MIEKRLSLLFFLCFLVLSFIYIFFRIDPTLIYQAQEPVFFFDTSFVAQFLHHPGGVNALFSAFLSQFFYKSWSGALVLVLLFAIIAGMTKRFQQTLNPKQPVRLLFLFPATLLLAAHQDYNYPLVFTLGVLWILVGFTLYVRVAPSNSGLRLLFYAFLFALLYFVAAAQAFIFSITILLYEMLYHRRFILPVFYLLYAILLPWLGAAFVFLISTQNAYKLQLFFYEAYKANWLTWILFAYFPLVLIFKAIEVRFHDFHHQNKVIGKLFSRKSPKTQIASGIVIFTLAIILIAGTFEKSKKTFLQIDYHMQFGDWHKVLELVRQGRSPRSVVESQAYRALYHSGRLGDELFHYTKHFGGDGLFMHQSTINRFPRQHSDLFFDLGLINEAKHWAYEAQAMHGETAWILQRLVLINIAEGNVNVAARYLQKLEQTMWHRGWAKQFRQTLQQPQVLFENPKFHFLKTAMPQTDFLVSPVEPKLCLDNMVEIPENRMAFEYYMANCLLEGNISDFIKQIPRLNDFGYSEIPRHFEEAILVYIQLTGRKNIGLTGLNISDATIRRFIDFNQILQHHNKNADLALGPLGQKYRHTYWFYALYQFRSKG